MLDWALWFVAKFGWLWSVTSFGVVICIWVGAFSLPALLRPFVHQLCIALLVFSASCLVANRIWSEAVLTERASWQKQLKAETARREQVLAESQTRQKATIDALTAERNALKGELDAEKASHIYDAVPGIAADGVLRLNAIGGRRTNHASHPAH